ncbi:fructokinase-like protein [Tasmannia lanceolata]|uniref:fructokinase-like protein n=1 Tax=Tasmannia lanceolata TaxID=3420 RepID=UPI004064A197
MASLSVTHPFYLSRWRSNWPIFVAPNFVQLQELRLQNKWGLGAVSKKSTAQSGVPDSSNEEGIALEKASNNTKRIPRRTKKVVLETPVENDVSPLVSDVVASGEESKKVPRKSQKKATPMAISDGESTDQKVIRKRRTRKKIPSMEDQINGVEISHHEGPSLIENAKDGNEELQFRDDGEDISFTYDWPPLVCCFGAAQHAFIPSGRPANRMIDHEIHETNSDWLWSPPKFVRAPGGASSSVAVALSSIGGRVAFMGKLGDDEYGQSMLYYLNANNVQTRSVKVDKSKRTGVSKVKISRRGGLRLTSVKPCAEDCLLTTDINIDVLKEAKMFYFNSSSLLDQNMRSTTLQAIKVSKRLGGLIFFDLNLPLPLRHSSEETKMFIKQAWNYADFIEVTKQELEFLCGIEPSEKFDTKDNDKSKFIHHKPEVIMPLWHESLKVLFVTNGTSKIHYYTQKDNGFVRGMEDPPITPFTCDMSASGDAIVAALMRMLTVQPHLATDKGYLEHMIKYAINCGVTDQWKLARIHGYPPKGKLEPNGIRSITEKEYRTLEPAS